MVNTVTISAKEKLEAQRFLETAGQEFEVTGSPGFIEAVREIVTSNLVAFQRSLTDLKFKPGISNEVRDAIDKNANDLPYSIKTTNQIDISLSEEYAKFLKDKLGKGAAQTVT